MSGWTISPSKIFFATGYIVRILFFSKGVTTILWYGLVTSILSEKVAILRKADLFIGSAMRFSLLSIVTWFRKYVYLFSNPKVDCKE